MDRKKKRVMGLIAGVSAAAVCAVVLFFLPTGKQTMPVGNILVITLDTTRADRIGAYGYTRAETPNIDKLAREGVLFEDAFSSVPITLPSHCSIFTGTSVLYHKVKNNGTYFLPGEVETLAEILKRRGFDTSAFISSFTLDSRFGLEQGFDIYNDDVAKKDAGVKAYASERQAGAVFRDFSQWFEQHYGKRFFCWVHFYDPHMPYEPPEPYRTRFKTNRYDGEIAYMDENVGRIISLLKSKGVLDQTLVVVAGDHGEAFGEHGELGHQIFCYEENLQVPLIFWAADGLPKNKRIEEKVNLTDVMPTILDYLGLAKPAKPATPGESLRGRSLLPLLRGGELNAETFYINSEFARESLGCAPVKGIVKDGYKYLDLPRPELYYLPEDPGEKENLYFKRNALARRMKQTMAALVKKSGHSAFQSKRTLTGEEARRLETLGYISSARGGANPDELPDPKDKIRSWSEYMRGNQMLTEGRTDEAVESFRNSVEANPKFSWAHAKLASLYYGRGEVGKAAAQYRAGMAGNPDDNIIKADYANLLMKEKRYDEAEEILKVLREMNPMDVGAHVNNLLGSIYMAKGDFESAASCYRQGLEMEPENRMMKTLLAFSCQRSNRLSEALEIYGQLEREDPDDHNVLFNMAMVYGMKEEYESSRRYFERAIKVKETPVVYYNYAFILSKAGEYGEAVEKMNKFLEMYPPDDATRRGALEFIERMKGMK